MIGNRFLISDIRFFAIPSRLWTLGHNHRQPGWGCYEVHGHFNPFSSRVFNVSNGSQSAVQAINGIDK